jgi:hypothetical protein
MLGDLVIEPPIHHLRALRERLVRDGRVEFHNGSVVSVEHGTDLRITWPGTDIYGYVNQWAYEQLGRAYELALAGRPPVAIEPVRRPKRQPPRRDFGSVPF